MRATICLSLALFCSSCAIPITAENVGADAVYRSHNANALTEHEPSNASRLALHRANLTELYDSDPRAALAALHRAAVGLDRRDRLFALAELSLLTARGEDDRSLDVAAATYAYLFLLGDADTPPPGAFDRRFRLAADIYNRALVEAFREPDGRWVPREGTYELPVGHLTVEVPDHEMHVGDQAFDEFRPSADYEVRGMSGRINQSGLGSALIAGAPRRSESAPGEISPGVLIGGNAFLEVLGELDAAEEPGLRAVLTLHSGSDASQLVVRGRSVPLEVDATTPLAYSLRESKLWDFELGSFLSPDKVEIENGLTLLAPYERGKIPIVFVHGTASSPARWAEMINELGNDPVLRSHYTAWLFIYKTSAPILQSASSLREGLTERIADLDPDGTDEALRRMVVIGHSQGGLLSRLTVTDSGNRFWENVSDRPFDDLDLDAVQKERLRAGLFFEPLPFVERVVFISTPHRGSFLSEGLLRTIANALISIPEKTLHLTQDVVAENTGLFRPDFLERTPTAVDNMSPGHPFLTALEQSPMPSRVHKHSIVAVTDIEPPLEERDDGVVMYTSAHLEGVDSEKVVLSGHSVQDNPVCILEVRRILREHLVEINGATR